MAVLLSAHQLKKSFSHRPLFESLTFAVDSGERIGLIGPNGAGKSTLLKILAGLEQPDEGKLSRNRGLRIGYLEQVPQFQKGTTLLAAVTEGAGEAGDWAATERAQEAMSRLSLDKTRFDPDMLVEKMSGGWRKRVALARELAREPDLLLLDEPTNHLDLESILWLEEFLARAPFAVVTVTHDRLFLERVANRIVELDRRNPEGMLSVQGTYAEYLEIKNQLMETQGRQEERMKNTFRRETEWLRQGAKARTTKQQARIQRAEQLGDDVGKIEDRNRVRSVKLDFVSAERNPKKLLEAKGISKAKGGKPLFPKMDLILRPGDRIGILGSNGCGKSTLIRVLLGQDTPDSGDVKRADGLQVAYFEQNRDSLDPELSVLKTICPSGDFVDFRGGRVHIRSYLDRFLFSGGQAEMKVGKLSGGEQSRLLIARLMLRPANLLVLDEPTNDLDMATLGVLEDVLVDFPGAVLLVTHDRYFLDVVSNRILAFFPHPKNPEVIPCVGIGQWETLAKERIVREKDAARTASSSGGGGAKTKTKLSYKDQREFDTMEERIQACEEKLAALEAESARPEIVANAKKLVEVTGEMSKLQGEIEALYMRWSELAGGG